MTTKQISDNNRKLWDVIESLPTKTVPGGQVDLHLCCEVCTGSQHSWAVIAEQRKDNGVSGIRSQVFGTEAEARTAFAKLS